MQPWIDVDEAKAHLGKKSSADDDELSGFIEAACAMVEDIKGHVDPVTVVETLEAHTTLATRQPYTHYQYWDHLLLLTQIPVASVASVEYLPGDGTTSVVAEQDPATGVAQGWRLVGTVLHVPFFTHRFGAYRVTYTAGLNPILANYRMAALELTAHLWRSTQLNASQGKPQIGETDPEFIRGMTYALPFRVRELLGIYGSNVGVAGVTLA